MHRRGKDGIWRDDGTEKTVSVSKDVLDALRVSHKALSRALDADESNDDIRDAALDVVGYLNEMFN